MQKTSEGKPTAKDVAARFIILSELLSHCWLYLNEPTAEEANELLNIRLSDLRQHGLWDYATVSEKEVFKLDPLSLGHDYAEKALLRANAEAVLAWCLGMIKDMPPFDIHITDEDCPY